MTAKTISVGDFVRMNSAQPGRVFYYSSDSQHENGLPELRIRFTEAAAALCPNRIVFRNGQGDSMTVREVKRVRVERDVLPGIDRFTLVSGYESETMCVVFSENIQKRIDMASRF